MSAAGILILRNCQPLAVLGPTRGWGLPFGKAEPNETPAQTAMRECFEETGMQVDFSTLVPLYEGPAGDRQGDLPTFWAADPGGHPKKSEEGEAAFVPWETLFRGPFEEYNRRVYECALDRIPELWAQTYGSGTLRRAIEEGMAFQDLYHHERVAMEFGFGFELINKTQMTFGKALAEGDDPGTTETCWHVRTLRFRAKRDGLDRIYKVGWARVEYSPTNIREGLGILCETPNPNRPSWIPAHKNIFAFTTTKEGVPINPC